MTLDKLATMTQEEFRALRSEMATKDDLKVLATKDDLRAFATKEDLQHLATKVDLQELKDDVIGEVRKENTKVIQSNDRVVARLDTLMKDFAAHDSLHKRITDDLHDHGTRIKKLEETKAA